MLNFSLKQLEVFVAIVESGSFTKAANRLYMAQSTVSAHISSLERELGVVLFLRNSKRNIQITETGRRIFIRACEILKSCQELENEILIDKSNELILGASTVPASCLLPRYIPKFSRKHPDARFSVKKGDSGSVHQMLAEGELHLAFVGSSIKHSAFQYDEISRDSIVLITPAREPYLSYQKQGVLGKELLTHPLLFRESGSGTQKVVDEYLANIGMKKNKLNIVGRFGSSASIVKLVGQGLGLSMISHLLVQPYVDSGCVLEFPLEVNPQEVSRSYYMLSRKNGDYSELQSQFMNFIREDAKELLAKE